MHQQLSGKAKVKPTPAFAPLFAPESTTPPKKGGGVGTTGATGLEPATSGVTGRRSNQLSYAPE